MPRSIRTVGLWCCLLFSGCADTAVQGPATYVVRPQDTLYSIAWRHDLDYRDLARWNRLGPDYRIAIGQVLLLAPGPAPGAASGPGRRGMQAPAAAARSAAPGPAPAPAPATTPGSASLPRTGASPTWVWPTAHATAPTAVAGGGIFLSGVLGQDIRAAYAGRVVYAGSGLRGYGHLIIIKHGDSLLSAYAHNREVLVHEGQDVTTGQVIAHMGQGSRQAAVLYFEIRQNGKPVNPLPFFSR